MLEETLNNKHPLYCQDNSHSAKPIRLMVSLSILKNIRITSDEGVVENGRKTFITRTSVVCSNFACSAL